MAEVLFLCTGNSCRSQMAEGFARAHWPQGWSARSAGIETHGMNPFALQVMAEAGIDLANHYSKTVDDLGEDYRPDLVVTVCGHADETCPTFPGAPKVVHQGFDDPPRLAADLEGEARLAIYRRVRDEIESYVLGLPQSTNL